MCLIFIYRQNYDFYIIRYPFFRACEINLKILFHPWYYCVFRYPLMYSVPVNVSNVSYDALVN